MKPVLVDAFCGAGGATKGYQRAGFHVVGIDHKPQPHYCGDEFYQADALDVLRWLMTGRWQAYGLRDIAAIHASPPCQHYANVTRWRGDQADHPDLIPATLKLLRQTGLPWVLENVPASPIEPHFILCGSMFGLAVRRHRWFATSWRGFALQHPCSHAGLLPFEHKGERAYADAMGCEWMNKTEAREAIPPAYTEWIGARLLEQMESVA